LYLYLEFIFVSKEMYSSLLKIPIIYEIRQILMASSNTQGEEMIFLKFKHVTTTLH